MHKKLTITFPPRTRVQKNRVRIAFIANGYEVELLDVEEGGAFGILGESLSIIDRNTGARLAYPTEPQLIFQPFLEEYYEEECQLSL